MSRLTVNGALFDILDQGDGPAFVLLHGWTGCKEDWQDHIDVLATKYRVIAYDHRGHGASEHAGNYSFPQLLADLEGVLSVLGVDECALLGHSMGGMIVQMFALTSPQRVRAMILEDTGTGRVRMPEPHRQVILGLVSLAREQGMEAVFGLQERAGGLAPENPAAARLREEHPERVEQQKKKFLAVDPAAYGDLLHEMMEQEDRLVALSSLAIPSLVMVGEHDVAFHRISHRMVERMADTRLAWIEGAGHSPHSEAPESWRASVCGFLDEVFA